METRTDTKDLRRFVSDLRKMRARTTDVSSASKSGAQELQKVLDQTFAAGRSPDGQPWAPLKPSTIARKGSSKPLVQTGRLRNARRATPTKKGVDVEVTRDRARVAAILARGTAERPARSVLPAFTKGGPAYNALRASLSRIARFVFRGTRR